MPSVTHPRTSNATAVSSDGAVGARVKSLREAMDLSLRDLAERSGVSAPMLSQVERGETSPTLAVARRSPAAWISPSPSCFASTRTATWSSFAPATGAPVDGADTGSRS